MENQLFDDKENIYLSNETRLRMHMAFWYRCGIFKNPELICISATLTKTGRIPNYVVFRSVYLKKSYSEMCDLKWANAEIWKIYFYY